MIYPDAFFDLSDEERAAYEAEVQPREGESAEAAKLRRAELREKYVDVHVGTIRTELTRLDMLWSVTAIGRGPSMGDRPDMRPGVIHQWHPAGSLDVPHADDVVDE
jgi:hypothetical protein